MNKMKNFNSIVSEDIFHEFEKQRGVNIFNHSSNSIYIDDFISVAYVLCPKIIEIKGYIFIADFLNSIDENTIEKLEKRFNYDIKNIEMFVNSWSFGDFFLGKDCKSMENEKILKQFGEILVYFWSRRVKELFPQKNIVVEYGDSFGGELGLAITMYQK